MAQAGATTIRPPTTTDGMTGEEVSRWHADQAVLAADPRTAGSANRPSWLVARVLDEANRPKSRTYVSRERWRSSEVGGAGHLTRTETIHADGRIEWSVRGWSQDEGTIDSKGTRTIDPAALLDGAPAWERIYAARLSSGWELAS